MKKTCIDKEYRHIFVFNGEELEADVKLDAVITNVSEPKIENIADDVTIVNTAIVTIYHNQNPIAIADCYADAGNEGYYYSVCAFKINCNYYKIVSA